MLKTGFSLRNKLKQAFNGLLKVIGVQIESMRKFYDNQSNIKNFSRKKEKSENKTEIDMSMGIFRL